MVTRGNLNLNC